MNKNNSVQVLRGIAACMVVIIHVVTLLDYYSQNNYSKLFYQLNAGVDIFFVISGLIMSVLLLDGRKYNFKDFIRRRIVRIAPLYWICTLVWGLIFFDLMISNPELLLRSMLFLPPLGKDHEVEPFLAIGWSLTYEFFFYFTIAFLYKKNLFNFLRKITIFYVLTSLVSIFYEFQSTLFHVIFGILKLEFIIGLWIGWLLVNGKLLSLRLSYFMIFISILMFIFSPMSSDNSDQRLIFWGVPAGIFVLGFVGLPIEWNKIAVQLGDISYSLYLTHVFSIRIVGRFLVSIEPILPLWLLIIIMLLISVVVAKITYIAIELPLIKYAKNYK